LQVTALSNDTKPEPAQIIPEPPRGPRGGKRAVSWSEQAPYGSARPYVGVKEGYTKKGIGKGAHRDEVVGE